MEAIYQVFDKHRVELILNAFSTFSGLSATIFDVNGTVHQRVGWQSICTDFHHQPDFCKSCIVLANQLAGTDNQPPLTGIKTCPCGLMVGTAPVVSGGHIAGKVVISPFLSTPGPDSQRQLFKTLAQRYALEEATYLQAVKKIPIVPVARAKQALTFLSELAAFLVTTANRLKTQLQALKTLEAQETFWNNLMEAIPGPIFFKDNQGVYRDCNKAFEALIGKNQKDIIGHTVFDIIPPDKAGIYHQSDQALFSGADHQTCETEVVDAHGRHRQYLFHKVAVPNTQLNIEGIVGVMLDITERKQAEAALQKSDLRFRTLIEALPEALLVVDTKGRTLFMNNAAERFFGQSSKDLIGLKLGLPLEALEPTEIEVTIGKESSKYAQVQSVRSLWEEQSAYIISLRDTTEQIISRRKQRQLETQLQQSQKMESIGVLAGGIAHDFNNILTAILGFGELAIEDINNQHSLRNYLDEILTAGNRAKELTAQILTFSRQAPQEVNKVSPPIIIKEVCKLLRATLPANIDITQEINTETFVMADATQIHQVIMNLCANASHAMQTSGGTLSICLQDTDIDKEFSDHHPGMLSGKFVQLTVADTGIGMSNHVMQRIFDPFFTTKKKREGTGMGLAVVHGIVKNHGGTVTVESALGKGSAFHVYLPAAEPANVSDPYTDMSLFEIHGNETILFVDDEEPITLIGKAMLERLGYMVVTRNNAKAALDLIQSKPGHFDIVITDMAMPKMTGLELAQRLRQLAPKPPIILCTGFSASLENKTLEQLNVDAVLIKPIIKEHLGKTIRRLLQENTAPGECSPPESQILKGLLSGRSLKRIHPDTQNI